MEFYVDSIEQMCELMCGSIEREEEEMISQKFTENVVNILKHDGEKIGDFEKRHGLSTGYLSRIANFTIKNVSLDVAYAVAEDLGMSIDEIITTDWVKEFEEEDRKARIEDLEKQKRQILEELEKLKS